MPVCSVVGCRTGHSRHAQRFTSFHRFPKDPALFTEWIRRTGVSAAGRSERKKGAGKSVMCVVDILLKKITKSLAK